MGSGSVGLHDQVKLHQSQLVRPALTRPLLWPSLYPCGQVEQQRLRDGTYHLKVYEPIFARGRSGAVLGSGGGIE